MSQPQPGLITRKQAVDSLAEILIKDSLPTDPKWEEALSDVLKDFAAKYCELSLKGPDGHLDLEMRMHKDAPSQFWHVYFVQALRKMLKDLPANTEDLLKAVRGLTYGNCNGNAVEGNFASPDILRELLRTGFDVNNNSKRPVTEHDELNTPNRTKRIKTEADATNFTVHAKSPYTVRVFEGNIPVAEFSSSTPATVQVKMVPGSAASAAAVHVDCDESDN